MERIGDADEGRDRAGNGHIGHPSPLDTRRFFPDVNQKGDVTVEQDQRGVEINPRIVKRRGVERREKRDDKEKADHGGENDIPCADEGPASQEKMLESQQEGESRQQPQVTDGPPDAAFKDTVEKLPALLNKDRKAEGRKGSLYNFLFLPGHQRNGDDEANRRQGKGFHVHIPRVLKKLHDDIGKPPYSQGREAHQMPFHKQFQQDNTFFPFRTVYQPSHCVLHYTLFP